MKHDMSRGNKAASLITPYGGRLVNLLVSEEEGKELVAKASRFPSIQLSPRSLCDLELLAVGAFSPLDRFMGKEDYDRVLAEMRLEDGTLFPIPITLPVASLSGLEKGKEIGLRNAQNELIALMTIDEIYQWELARETAAVLGSNDPRHPLIPEMQTWGKTYVSGPLRVFQLPKRYVFFSLQKGPAE